MSGLRSDPEPDLWRHAGELALLVGGGTFALAALAAHRVPLWMPGVATAAGWAVAVLATLWVMGEAGTVAVYALVCALVGIGWTLYALVTTPWSLPAIGSLAIAAIVLVPLYPVVRGNARKKTAMARRQAEYEAAMEERRRWPKLLEELGFKGVKLIDSTETRAGHTHVLQLPASGRVTLGALVKATERIEVAANHHNVTGVKLRRGAIRFEEVPERADHVLLHVAENDILAQEVPWPGDLSNLTVNRPVDVGVHEDGQKCTLLLREVATLVVGLRGSGKSNLINVLIAQLARCVDVVIFMIDNKGGRTAAPWLRPWIDKRCERPVIDWVATDRDEAERMLRSVVSGINGRAHAGAARGTEKVIPSPRTPAVVVVFEEIAVIFGMNRGPKTSLDGTTNSTLAGLGMDITQLGRSEAIDPVFVTQRGTVTMVGSGDMKSQLGLRIGLGVKTEEDARMIIPDDQSAARLLPKLKHPGSGLVSYRDQRPAPVKFYRLTNDQIEEIAEECGNRRPAVDPELEDALGDDYRTRWERQERLLKRSATVTAIASSPVRSADDVAFQEIVEGEFAGDEMHPARVRMLEILRERGVRGATVEDLRRTLEREGAGVVRQTLHKWLAEEIEGGHVTKATYGRYKAA